MTDEDLIQQMRRGGPLVALAQRRLLRRQGLRGENLRNAMRELDQARSYASYEDLRELMQDDGT